jgi:hypothetical protein
VWLHSRLRPSTPTLDRAILGTPATARDTPPSPKKKGSVWTPEPAVASAPCPAKDLNLIGEPSHGYVFQPYHRKVAPRLGLGLGCFPRPVAGLTTHALYLYQVGILVKDVAGLVPGAYQVGGDRRGAVCRERCPVHAPGCPHGFLGRGAAKGTRF